MDEEDNALGYFQNNNDYSDKYKDVNAGDDNIYVDNLVCEDIYNSLVIQDISDHYCGPHGFKEVVDKLFQNFIECIMLASGI